MQTRELETLLNQLSTNSASFEFKDERAAKQQMNRTVHNKLFNLDMDLLARELMYPKCTDYRKYLGKERVGFEFVKVPFPWEVVETDEIPLKITPNIPVPANPVDVRVPAPVPKPKRVKKVD